MSEEEEKQWEIEQIIQRGVFNNELYYRVTWKGYPEDQATWEPISNLEHSAQAILKFEKSVKKLDKLQNRKQTNVNKDIQVNQIFESPEKKNDVSDKIGSKRQQKINQKSEMYNQREKRCKERKKKFLNSQNQTQPPSAPNQSSNSNKNVKVQKQIILSQDTKKIFDRKRARPLERQTDNFQLKMKKMKFDRDFSDQEQEQDQDNLELSFQVKNLQINEEKLKKNISQLIQQRAPYHQCRIFEQTLQIMEKNRQQLHRIKQKMKKNKTNQ